MSRPAGKHRQKATLAALGVTGLVAFGAAPAGAAVAPGHTILSAHNIDFIGAFGYTVGEELTISVARPGRGVIASVTAPAADTPDGGGLELNHGPEGQPVPGDCWEDQVPDVLPGDTIRVAYAGGEDSIVVDDIDILRAPRLVGEDVVVEGIARDGAGNPIPVEVLDSGEVRNATSRVRATATKVERIAGTTDRWRATYELDPADPATPAYGVFRNDGGVGLAAQRDAILTGEHAIGYGHPIVPLAPVIQLVDGIGGGGAAAGCPTDIPFERNSIEGADRTAITIANQNEPLVVNGLAASDVTAAGDVTITVNGEQVPATVGVNTVAGTWRAEIAPADIPAADGTVTIAADFPDSTFDTIDGARITTLELTKDTVAPGAPTANPPAGTYEGARNVTLSGEDGATIRYTNNGSTPTATSLVASGAIAVTASQTLRAIAFDAVGNPSAVTTLDYVITQPQPQPRPQAPVTGSGTAGVGVTVTTGAGAPAAAGSGVAKARLSLSGLTVSTSMSRRSARRNGLRVAMRLKQGTKVVRLRVYRKNRNGTRTLLAQGFRVPKASGLYRVRLQDPKLRVALRPGSYEIEATPGASRSDLGKSSRAAFRVRR